jgi:hypothetical protein
MSDFSFDELKRLIKEQLSERFPARLVEASGQGMVSATGGEELIVKVPEFTIDPSWISRNVEQATNEESYKRFVGVITSAGLASANINDVKGFITKMNQFAKAVPDAKKDYSVAISRIMVLKTLYSLAKAELALSAGFLLERWMAMVFDGDVIKTSEPGIVDVTFKGAKVSLKFLKLGGKVTGSKKKLMQDVEKGTTVNYIICEKPSKGSEEIRFFSFLIGPEQVDVLMGAKTQEKKASKLPEKEEGLLEEGKTERFSVTLTQIKNSGIAVDYLGAIDLADIDVTAQKIMDQLNVVFKGLVGEVQGLSKQVEILVGAIGEKEKTKTAAKTAGERAKEAETSAADIEKSA